MATLSTRIFTLTLLLAFASYGVAREENIYGGIGPPILCIYPLSGQYALLQRLLFYALLLFGAFGRREKWLRAGAIATVMLYSSSAAIHTLILLPLATASSTGAVLDLDIYGTFGITSTAVLFSLPLLSWSSTFHTSKAALQIVVLLWAFLCFFGAIFSAATLYVKNHFVDPPTCVRLAESPFDLGAVSSILNSTANCTYSCYAKQSLLRSASDVQAYRNKLGAAQDVSNVFIINIGSSILSAIICEYMTRRWSRGKQSRCIADYTDVPAPIKRFARLEWLSNPLKSFDFSPQQEPKQQEPTIQPKRQTTNLHVLVSTLTTPPSINSSSSLSRASTCLTLTESRTHPSNACSTICKEEPAKHKPSPLWLPFRYFSVFGVYGSFAANVILVELHLRDLPTNEQPYEIGQWSPWVSVGMVAAAQVVKWLVQRHMGHNKKEGEGEESHLDRLNLSEKDYVQAASNGWEPKKRKRRNSV